MTSYQPKAQIQMESQTVNTKAKDNLECLSSEER